MLGVKFSFSFLKNKQDAARFQCSPVLRCFLTVVLGVLLVALASLPVCGSVCRAFSGLEAAAER